MNQQTQVKNVRVRSRAARLAEMAAAQTRVEELPPRRSFGEVFLKVDHLARDLMVVGCLFLVVVAVKNVGVPESQSVFSAIQASAGMEWDESVGKLSFVNSLLPAGVRAVWNEHEDIAVFAPVTGEVVHAWSQREPYVMLETRLSDVRAAADGEVMSIAHGLDEERIVRIRHDDHTETLYGNLKNCHVSEGDQLCAGDVFAELLDGKPLAFELRVDGRSVDPAGRMKEIRE